MQLQRTNRAFRRWTSKDLGLEAQVIREGNRTIRDLFLANGHLVPPELMEDAMRLIEHYDAWLLKFDAIRGEGSKSDEDFVFVGPDGYPFPHEAESHVKEAFQSYSASCTAAILSLGELEKGKES
jgi:hypothetical protein